MKNLFFACMIACLSLSATAQVNQVTLQASGLTCSMCSNAINKALKTIPYVDKITANIKTSSFNITFKPGAAVRFDDLKKKVEDAGFFVAKLTANINFTNTAIAGDAHVPVNGMLFHFVHVKDQTISGVKTVQVIDKGYVSAKDFRKNEAYTNMECYKTGVAGTCCKKAGVASTDRIYHVTI